MGEAASDIVDQVATAILSETPANYVSQSIAQAYRNAEIALAIIEPMIRADERENGNWVTPYRDALMRALRTQMEALPRWRMDDTLVQVVAYEDVLALIARSGGSE